MAEPASQPERKPRQTLSVVITALAVVAALVGAGVYGLTRGSETTPTNKTQGSTDSTVSPPADPTAEVASPSPITPTGDPEAFARRVALAVFAWDTATAYRPSDYIQAIINVGDPRGNETPGLVADLADYLPNTAAWAQLRQYQTRQWLTIDTSTVPSTWAQALQQGQATLLPGTTAYTITGIRHRAGVWDSKPVTTSEHVSFTVFETCQPTYGSCRLLRLSQLDNPLR